MKWTNKMMMLLFEKKKDTKLWNTIELLFVKSKDCKKLIRTQIEKVYLK